MANSSQSPTPDASRRDILTDAEIQAILDNLPIAHNMSQASRSAAQGDLDQGRDLLDAMQGGALDLSAGGPAPQNSEEAMSVRETVAVLGEDGPGDALNIVPEIVQTRQQLLRELFPNGDAAPVWESAGPTPEPGPSLSTPPTPIMTDGATDELVGDVTDLATDSATEPDTEPLIDIVEELPPSPIEVVPLDPVPPAGLPPAPWSKPSGAPAVQPGLPASGSLSDLGPDPRFDDGGSSIGPTSYRVLQTEIAALYGEVRELLSPDQDASKRARTLLSEASIMLKGQPDQLDPVEAKVQQVREVLRQAQLSQRYADAYGRRVLTYLGGWLLLSLGGIIYFYLDGSLLGGDAALGLGRHSNSFVITLFWGAIGGVLSSVHSLWWHVSEAQDYHYRFNVSYLFRPVVGLILGGVIYALFAFAFDTLSLDLPGNLLLGLVPSLIALVVGFRTGWLLRVVGFSPAVT